MEKGREEGIIEGMMDMKFGEIGLKIMESIRKINDLTKLEAIKEAIRKANTIDDVVKVL